MADTGMGNFNPVSAQFADLMKRKTLSGRLFEVGETVKVKESRFTVESIDKHILILRLIPDDNYQQVPTPPTEKAE